MIPAFVNKAKVDCKGCKEWSERDGEQREANTKSHEGRHCKKEGPSKERTYKSHCSTRENFHFCSEMYGA